MICILLKQMWCLFLKLKASLSSAAACRCAGNVNGCNKRFIDELESLIMMTKLLKSQ